MNYRNQIAFLGLAFASSLGCASTNGHAGRQVELSSELSAEMTSARTSATISKPATDADANRAIRTVAFQEDAEANEGTDLVPSVPEPFYATEPNSEPVDASATETSAMTLGDFQSLAVQNNPSIGQVAASVQKASAIRDQVSRKPNPMVSYFGDEMGNDGGGLHGFFISQTFVRGKKLEWNTAVLNQDVSSAQWAVEAQRFRVQTDIRSRFYAALASQKRLALAREFQKVATKGVEISEARFQADEGTQADILQSEIQVSEVDLTIRQGEVAYQAAWNELVTIAGIPDLPPTTLSGQLPENTPELELQTVFEHISAQTPVLKSAQARIDRAHANLHRQQVQPTRNINAQFGLGHDDSSNDEFANIQLSMPLRINNKNEGNIRAAEAECCAARQNLQRLRMQLRRDVARVLRRYHSAKAAVDQYESSILPKAKKTLTLFSEALEVGEFDFLRVLTARKTYFDSNLKYVAALNELAQAATDIDGLLLSDSLSKVSNYSGDDSLRGQALSGQ